MSRHCPASLFRFPARMSFFVLALSAILGICSRVADAQAPIGYGKPSTALESSHIFKTAQGILVDFQVNIQTCASSPCWVLLIDASTVPADGTVTPAKWWQVSANTTLGVSFALNPLLLTSGIILVCSTTGPFTKTATAQCLFSGETQ